jgi:hypothetical protein
MVIAGLILATVGLHNLGGRMINYLLALLRSISWSSAAGIIFGAAISAIVAYVLQRNSFVEARSQKRKDRFEVRKALAFSLFIKLIRIHSTITLLKRSLDETLADAKAVGRGGQLWQIISPYGVLPDRVKFSTEEIALLLSLDVDLFNSLGPYDDIHNSLLDLFQLYSTRRNSAVEKFGAKMEGAIGVTALSKEEMEWLSPRAFELNQLVETMVQRSTDDAGQTKTLLERMHKLFVKEFGLNPGLEYV